MTEYFVEMRVEGASSVASRAGPMNQADAESYREKLATKSARLGQRVTIRVVPR